MTSQQPAPITLIGEEIAGPWNVQALADIAPLLGRASYVAYEGDPETTAACGVPSILSHYDCLIAAENLSGAHNVYTFRPPGGGKHALLVGNEAKGLRRRTRKLAHATIQIPLASRNINCLNVAAAAAVMLYYLSLEAPLNVKQRTLAQVQANRPDLLLVGGRDHMELGSTLRSACAFGWERLFLDDPKNAWYECDRRIKSEGRGMARRGRNPIRVLPYREELLAGYRRIVVFMTQQSQEGWHAGPQIPFASAVQRRNPGASLKFPTRPSNPDPCAQPYHLSLTGKDLLVVLPDEQESLAPWPAPSRQEKSNPALQQPEEMAPWSPPAAWHGETTYAALPQASPDRYHYRQMSAIALAEIARQLGEPGADGIYLRSKRDRYRREMPRAETAADLDLEDLLLF